MNNDNKDQDQITVHDMTLCEVCGECTVITVEEGRKVCINCIPELD